MPRRKLIRTDQYPYHVWNRSRNKDWYNLPMDVIWEKSGKILKKVEAKTNIKLHAFVLMHNHYHMILSTPNENIDEAMYYFNKQLSEEIRSMSNRINQIFGGRYKWSIINQRKYLFHVFKYVLRNPVTARLVDKCEKYEFSTWKYQLLNKPFNIPLNPLCEELDERGGEGTLTELADWINRPYDEIQEKSISLGLGKGHFAPSNKEQIPLELKDPFARQKHHGT